MFRKYEKTYRIRVPQFEIKGKHFLTKAEAKLLLGGKITITEKVDGANTGILRDKDWFRLQKRGSLVDTSEHEQFNFFKAWTNQNYEKILKVPKKYIVYGELMRITHHIEYDKLPDWFLVFAMYDKSKQRYIEWAKIEDLCNEWEFHTVPLIEKDCYYKRTSLVDLIPKTSNCGSGYAEGIVVWNYKHQLRGKLVQPRFIKELGEEMHWMNKNVQYNRLRNAL